MMKSPTWLRYCEKRLIDRYPYAANFLSLLYLDRWLIPAVIGAALTTAFGVGLFLKLWLNTPAGFEPAVKISAFDWLQAEALTRSAKKHEAAGRYLAAQAAWAQVISNAPGRPEPLRRYLELLEYREVDRGFARNTIRFGEWLLRLTDFDPADVELVARSLERGRRYSEVLRLADSQKTLTPGTQGAVLRALFWMGQTEAFGTHLDTALEAVRQDSMVGLYSAAVAALEAIEESDETPISALACREFLRKSEVDDPYSPEFLPARRLALRVLASAGEIEKAERVLRDLEKRRLASFADYLPYWKLLADGGRTTEVLQQASKAPEPVTTQEAYLLVDLLVEAGRIDDSLHVSRQMIESFGNPLNLWLDHGNLLVESERWGELRSLAMQVHQADGLTYLWSTAKYWEGVAELGLGHEEMAAERFDEIAEYPVVSVDTSLELVTRLSELGHLNEARNILHQLEPLARENTNYWVIRCQLAVLNNDLVELVDSAKKAHAANPDAVANINNLAVALLLKREAPAKALELGRQLVAQSGERVIHRLTLIHALIQNGLLTEAEAELKDLEGVNVPTADVLADFRLAQLELAYAQKRFGDVVAVGEALDTQFFMPEKVVWIEAAVAESRRHG